MLRFLTASSVEEIIYARALAKRGLERLLLHNAVRKKSGEDHKEKVHSRRELLSLLSTAQ